MLSLSTAGPIIVALASIQNIVGFSHQRRQIAVAPLSSDDLPSVSLQGLDTDENAGVVYDPGEDPFKSLSPFGTSEDYNDFDISEKDIWKTLEDEIREDQEFAEKSTILMKLLENPSMQELPIVYVEGDDSVLDDNFLLQSPIDKRSRYSRKNSWKRQNGRNRIYEADARYLCVPTREDVFKLLIGIHENRKGNTQKTVSFCNRKRPAKAIFSNIRFLA